MDVIGTYGAIVAALAIARSSNEVRRVVESCVPKLAGLGLPSPCLSAELRWENSRPAVGPVLTDDRVDIREFASATVSGLRRGVRMLHLRNESCFATVTVATNADNQSLSEGAVALLSTLGPHLHAAILRVGTCNQLSPRETEVANLVASGLRDREIGVALGISFSTVRTHINNILDRLGCANRTRLTALLLHRDVPLWDETPSDRSA